MFRKNILIKLFRHVPAGKNILNTQNTRIRKFSNTYTNVVSHRFLATNIQSEYEYTTITKKVTEEEYLVKIKDDPDTFGSDTTYKVTECDEGDVREEKHLESTPLSSEKLRTKQYADMIKDLIRKKKLNEAIDVLEVRMIKQDRVKPENYIYNLLLGACGRVGYTKKAFSLYNKMKQRDLVITGGTYTALFNACANSPWKEDGLTRAQHLREIIIEKGYEPNDTNYNSMIKAFGRCGDLKTAFNLVDEMKQKKIYIRADTLNFLLQACIGDKEAGFRHALLVWRKFINKKILPNIFSYNLLLRCIRDCGLGDADVTQGIFDNILQKQKLLSDSSNTNLLSSGDTDASTSSEIVDSTKFSAEALDITENIPNLIAKVPRLGNILAISEITKPEDRLLLVGGYSNFLNNMQENHCTPDIRTFTQLLDSIPGTLAAEKQLIITMKKLNVKPDIDFYNMLIKKRSMRFDYEHGKEVLNLIKTAKLRPNIMTYGVLALGCQKKEEAEALMQDMKVGKYRMNIQILGAMLKQACHSCNISYVLEIMEICVREEIRPNKIFMECLELFKKRCKTLSNDQTNHLSTSTAFQKGYQTFKMRYKIWKEEANPITEEESHPWTQFRQKTETNVKHYIDKDMSSRFKPRHATLYRKKENVIEKKNVNMKNRNRFRNKKQINKT